MANLKFQIKTSIFDRDLNEFVDKRESTVYDLSSKEDMTKFAKRLVKLTVGGYKVTAFRAEDRAALADSLDLNFG